MSDQGKECILALTSLGREQFTQMDKQEKTWHIKWFHDNKGKFNMLQNEEKEECFTIPKLQRKFYVNLIKQNRKPFLELSDEDKDKCMELPESSWNYFFKLPIELRHKIVILEND